MASGQQRAGGGGDRREKKLLDAAGGVAELWLETQGTTGHKKLDNALQRLTVAYRDWVGHQPDPPSSSASS